MSWKKIRLGTEIKRIGWDIALTSNFRATLPTDKKCRLETVLGLLSCKGRKIARKELEKATGLLSWFATGVRCLRPWLCHFISCYIHSPKINIKALDAKQLQEVHGLTVDGNISANAALSDVRKGWQIRASAEALLTTTGKHDQVWVKFAEWEPTHIRVTEAVAEAASFYKAMVQLQTPVPLLEADGPLTPAAADAFADAHSAGIFGWWLPPNKDLQPLNLKWFSIQLAVKDLPDWFHQGKKDLQTHICALEALAQLVLTACIIEDGLARPAWAGSVVLRQWSDNQGKVGAFTKNMSMRPSFARLCQQHGVASAMWPVNATPGLMPCPGALCRIRPSGNSWTNQRSGHRVGKSCLIWVESFAPPSGKIAQRRYHKTVHGVQWVECSGLEHGVVAGLALAG